MFSNAFVFRLPVGLAFTSDQLATALQSNAFMPCLPSQAESAGWVAPRAKSDVLAEVIAGQVVLKLMVETKAVPAQVIARAVDKAIAIYKQESGRDRVGAKLKKEFKEAALADLLPRAFAKQAATLVWIDTTNNTLVVDAASAAGADKVFSALVAVVSAIPAELPVPFSVKPLQTQESPAACMAHWLSSRDAPYRFTVDRECELKAQDDGKASVRYANHTLEIDEIAMHIAAGKLPTRLAMTWNSRVSFVLGELGQLSKICLLDGVLDGAADEGEDRFDADLVIATGELGALILDLTEALGGELLAQPE